MSKFDEMNAIARSSIPGRARPEPTSNEPMRLTPRKPTHIGTKLAKGAAGALGMGLDAYEALNDLIFGAAPKDKWMSEKVADYLKSKGISIPDVQAEGPVEEMLGHGAEFVGGSLVPGMGVLGNIGKGAKGAAMAAKSLAPLAAAGIGSGALQQTGLNPVAADIAASLTVPAAASKIGTRVGRMAGVLEKPHKLPHQELTELTGTKISPSIHSAAAQQLEKEMGGAEKVAEALQNLNREPSPIGYRGTIPERTENVKLAQLQNALYGHTPAFAEQQALDNVAIRNALSELEVAPQAEKAFSYRASPEEAGEVIQEKLSKNLSKLKSEREAASKPHYEELEKHGGVKPSITLDLIDKKLKTAKGPTEKSLLKIREMLEPNVKAEKAFISTKKGLEEIPNKTGNLPKALELDNVIKEVSDMMSVAKRKGMSSRARTLSEVKESLLEDLVNTPAGKARRVHAEKSEPIGEITKNKSLGKAVKKDVFEKRYLLDEDEAAKNVIKKAMASEKYSKGFLEQFGDDENAMKVIHGYINDDLIKSVSDVNKKISVADLQSWKESHPHAFDIYPELKGKVDNLQRKSLIDNMNKQIKLSSMDAHGNENISYPKLSNFLKSNDSALKEVFSGDQLKILNEVEKSLKGRQAVTTKGTAPGSPTASRLTLLGAVKETGADKAMKAASHFGLKGKVSAWLYKFIKSSNEAKVTDLVKASLLDENVAKILMSPLEDLKPSNKDLKSLSEKSPYILKIVQDAEKEMRRNVSSEED